MQADVHDQGFSLTGNFYLWSWDDFGKAFGKNRITRTVHDGYYYYTFWTRFNDTAVIYSEESVPVIQLKKDTLFDVNGDGYKDLVMTCNNNNGKCAPDFTILFLLDAVSEKFSRIKIIEDIPNVIFNPSAKTFSGKSFCDYEVRYYKFKWKKNFNIDTVFIRKTKAV